MIHLATRGGHRHPARSAGGGGDAIVSDAYQSAHHSCTFAAMPNNPNGFGSPSVTGHGASSGPRPPAGIHAGIALPHGYRCPSIPPRAARSHSASVGSRTGAAFGRTPPAVGLAVEPAHADYGTIGDRGEERPVARELVAAGAQKQRVGTAGHRVHRDVERLDPHAVHRSLLVGALVAAHLKPTFRDASGDLVQRPCPTPRGCRAGRGSRARSRRVAPAGCRPRARCTAARRSRPSSASRRSSAMFTAPSPSGTSSPHVPGVVGRLASLTWTLRCPGRGSRRRGSGRPCRRAACWPGRS